MDENFEWDQALAACEDDTDPVKQFNFENMKKSSSSTVKVSKSLNQKPPQSSVYSSQNNDDGWGYPDSDDNDWGAAAENQEMTEEKKDETSQQIMVYSQSSIVERIPMKIAKANELLNLDDEDQVIAILRYFSWNQPKLEETWFEEQEQLQYKIGLVFDPKLRKEYPEVDGSLAKNNENTCQICYLEFEANDEYQADQLVCGHQYNKMCWKHFLVDKVKSDGPACVFTKCPQLRCNVVVPHSFFLKYLEDKVSEDGVNYRKKYLNWHCKQMTDQNKNIKWCPQKGCDYMAEKTVYALKNTVECKCGFSYCFSCENEDHLPSTCSMVKIWMEKESSDSENITWIKANTKPCPKCTSLIEKNQGCMHMKCQKCNHDFCWLCLKEWSKHGSTTGGYYACNIYDDLKKSNKEFQKAQEIAEKSKNEILKYQFHYERYNNHQKSKEICIKQKVRLQKNMQLLNEIKNYPAGELLFFEQCADAIIRCRQVLKWTYVVSYYSEKHLKESKIHLFKFQQTALEEACEQTHKIMESDLSQYLDINMVDRTPFYHFRAELINKMKILEQSYESFVEQIINDENFQ